MVLTIKIPDELYERIGKLNPQNPRYAIERLLEKYADVGYSNKAIVVGKDELKSLQDLLGPIETPEDLEEKVRKALSFSVGGIEIELTEGQRKQIESTSKFFNQPQDSYAKQQILKGVRMVFGV